MPTFAEVLDLVERFPLTHRQAILLSRVIRPAMGRPRNTGQKCIARHPDTAPRYVQRESIKNGKVYAWVDCLECKRVVKKTPSIGGGCCPHPKASHGDDGCCYYEEGGEYVCECTGR